AALSGYGGELVIGGLADGFNLTQVAGDITINADLSVADQVLLLGDNIIMANGTLSANTVILLAAAEQGEIFNTGGNATLLEAETVVLVAGGAVGGSGDVNAQALSGTGTLEVATGSSVAFIVNIGNSLQFFSSPNTALAD